MIYLGADKQGFEAIKIAMEWLDNRGFKYENLGVKSKDQDMKLENLLPPIAEKVRADTKNLGIVSSGTGVGVEVGINKFSGIRACLADDPEVTEWSKIYDNCNVLCLIGWRPDRGKIEKILVSWFAAGYDGDSDRLKMMQEFDKWR